MPTSDRTEDSKVVMAGQTPWTIRFWNPAFAILGVILFVAACATDGQKTPSALQDKLPRMTLASEAEKVYDYASAAKHYKAQLETTPQNRTAVLGLARNLRKIGLAGEANQLMNIHADLYSKDPDYLLEMGKSALAKGDTQEAISVLRSASNLAPNDWRMVSTLGIAMDIAGQFTQAQNHYAQALALSPDNPDILNNLAMSLAQSGEIDKAVDTLERAANRDRTDAQIRQNLALMYAIQGDMTEARRLNELSLSPGQVETNLSFYSRFGNPEASSKPEPSKP